MKKILFIVTSADKMGDSKTGIWFEELSTPFYLLQDAGHAIDIVSPKGGKVSFDETAFEPENLTESVKRFIADKQAMDKVNNTVKVSAVNFSDYDAIFFPGGHGAVVDLPNDDMVANNLGKFFDTGKPVAAICHGPGGLVKAKRADGRSIVFGKKLCCFTNAEEVAIGVDKKVPFLLEDKLRELGGNFVCGDNFKSFAVKDGNLITGQNPASSAQCAKLVLEALK